MDAKQDLAKEKKCACGGCLALSKTSVVCLAVLALVGLAAAFTVVVVSIEKDNEFITSLMSSTNKVSGDPKSSQLKNAQPQSEDFNSRNFDKPTAVSDEFVAKGYDMLEPGLGNSAEKSKDKAESYEVEVEKMRIENKKLRDKAKIIEFKLEKLRNENDKLKEKSENVEVEVKKLRIENEKFKNENEKLRDKAKKSELKIEKLRIQNDKLNDEARNLKVVLDKLRIENEKLRDKAQNSEIRTGNLRRENKVLRAIAVRVEKLGMENDKLKDKTKIFEVELEKSKIENEKLIDKGRNSEVEVEKLKIESEKLKATAQNSEVEVERLTDDNAKLIAKAQQSEVEVEKLKTENEKLKDKAQQSEVEVEKLKTENEKLKDKAQNSEVEVEKLKTENEKLKDKAQNSEVNVIKLIDETGKVKDGTEKSRVESQILEDEIGEQVNDSEDPVYDTENSGADAEYSGDDAENSGDDADNSSDDADNSSDHAGVSEEAHTDAPEVSVSIRSSGLSMTLYCHVTASPPATEIYWSTPDRERIDSSMRRQYTESTQRNSLYYTRVNFAQVGGYSCTATNAVGTSTSNTVNITVHTTYKVYTDRRTYLEASKACNDHGGTLAMPTTAVEYQNMKNVVKRTPGTEHDLWIGITRKGNEWRYEEGPILGSWKNWASRQPDNSGGNQNCVSMRDRWLMADGWSDEECSFETQFVCQFNNIDPVHPPTSFDNPAVPFTAEILMGMRPGRAIYVKGIPNSDAIRFQMTLYSGPSYTPSDLPLYFDVRFKYGYQNTVVLNSMKQGFWGKHTTLTTFPFTPDVPFEIKILCEQSSFKIYVNNEYFADFPHRAEPESANYIKVVDGVRLTQVRFQDEM